MILQPDGTCIATSGNTVPDRNGNFISYSQINATDTNWYDTIGRQALRIEKTVNQTDLGVLDSDGSLQHYIVEYGNFSIRTAFGCPNVTEYMKQNIRLPIKLKLPTNQEYVFEYEPTPSQTGFITGRLKGVTLPTGGVYQYTYPGSNGGMDCVSGSVNHLTRRMGDGIIWSVWTFDRNLNVTKETSPSTAYESEANQSVYNFSGTDLIQEKLYQGLESPGNLRRTNDYTYSVDHRPLTITASLNDKTPIQKKRSSFLYDIYGNVTKIIDYPFFTSLPTTSIRTIEITYLTTPTYIDKNLVSLPQQVIIKDGNGETKSRTNYGYDLPNSLICNDSATGANHHDHTNFGCNYQIRGNLTDVTVYLNPTSGSEPIKKVFKYDQLGNLVSTKTDAGPERTWTYTVNTQWSLAESEFLGLEIINSRQFYFNTGIPMSETDPNGQIQTFSYDKVNRIKTINRGYDNSIISVLYDDQQNEVVWFSPIDATRQIVKKSKYDLFNRMIKETTSDDAGSIFSIFEQEYDPFSRPYRQRNPYREENEPGFWWETRYDALGRVFMLIPPDGSASGTNKTTFVFAGNETTITDPAGKQRKKVEDALGRITALYEADPGNSNSLSVVTNYSYDVFDNLIQVNQGNQVRSFSFDAIGRKTAENSPEAGLVQFKYQNWGALKQKIDARNVKTNYTYDNFGRLTGKSFDLTGASFGIRSSGVINYGFGTDPAQFNRGRLTSMTDDSGIERYSYL